MSKANPKPTRRMTSSSVGPRPTFAYKDWETLRFDPTNPRLGSAAVGKTQEHIQEILENEPHYARELVDSFLENGFIDYEPLVVRADGGEFVVVEGNRRLAAIRHILTNRPNYSSKSTKLDDLKRIPVLIFPPGDDEDQNTEQRVYLGVRHLFGFREWPAESKAKFLDTNIRGAEDLARTTRELNIKKTELRRYLIPYRLRKKAKALWDPYGDQDFWILGEGLSRSGIKDYVELDIDADSLQVRGFNQDKLKNLLQFIYGPKEKGKVSERRIRETRDLGTLSKVLQSKRAAGALEGGLSLDEAALFIETTSESMARLERVVRDLRLLLTGVLKRGHKSGVSRVLEQFDLFDKTVKEFIRDAKKSSL